MVKTDMRTIYMNLIIKLDNQIAELPIWKDGRIKQLYKKRDKLQEAMIRCN